MKNSSINQNDTNFKDHKFPFEFKIGPLYIVYIWKYIINIVSFKKTPTKQAV